MPRDQEILLVDEVDMFFGSNFYGKTHNQVAVLAFPQVETLLKSMWKTFGSKDTEEGRKKGKPKRKGDLSDMDAVFEWKEFNALSQKFPDLSDMVTSEVSHMCQDLKTYLKMGDEHILNGNRIGYKIMDGIVYDVVKGYQTAFAYLDEASKGHLDENVLGKSLALRIPCGRFSYANLGVPVPRILGVSATIEALSPYQWNAMQTRFGISSFTSFPSVYGDKKFAFLSQSHQAVQISRDEDHFKNIYEQAWKRRNFVLVVFGWLTTVTSPRVGTYNERIFLVLNFPTDALILQK